jgi:hypothetical protein
LFLAALLTAGVVGVLLLNTAMQRQSDLIAGQRERVSDLQQHARSLSARLDRLADPALLAARATALHLRPAKRIRYVEVSGRRPAGPRAHGG